MLLVVWFDFSCLWLYLISHHDKHFSYLSVDNRHHPGDFEDYKWLESIFWASDVLDQVKNCTYVKISSPDNRPEKVIVVNGRGRIWTFLMTLEVTWWHVLFVRSESQSGGSETGSSSWR